MLQDIIMITAIGTENKSSFSVQKMHKSSMKMSKMFTHKNVVCFRESDKVQLVYHSANYEACYYDTN